LLVAVAVVMEQVVVVELAVTGQMLLASYQELTQVLKRHCLLAQTLF
jgi:hypothetical protein